MQTSLKNNSNFFDRMMQVANANGINDVPELAKKLNYTSPEKLYRLDRINEATGLENKPSYDILVDLANMFVNMDVRWLLIGEGTMLTDKHPYVEEPGMKQYGLKDEVSDLKKRVSEIEKLLKSKKI